MTTKSTTTTPPTAPPPYGTAEWMEWVWDRDLSAALQEALEEKRERERDLRRCLAAHNLARGLPLGRPRLVVDNDRKCVAADAAARPHSEMKSESFKVRDTAHIDGGAYRWLELADGSWRVENWTADGWKPGGADISEFWDNPPVGPAFAARLGIPVDDLKRG
jgi:hypothetical protein